MPLKRLSHGRQTLGDINTEVMSGDPTQMFCSAFSSHILVMLNQKMGTLVSLEPSNVASDVSKPILITKVLLRQDESPKFLQKPGDICVSRSLKQCSPPCHGHEGQNN